MCSVSWEVPNTCKESSWRFCSVEPLLVNDVNQDTYQWSWGLSPTSCLLFFFEAHQTLQRGDSNFYLPLALSTEVCDVVPTTDILETGEKWGEVHRGKANYPLLTCREREELGSASGHVLPLRLDAAHRGTDLWELAGLVIPKLTEKTEITRTRGTDSHSLFSPLWINSLFVWQGKAGGVEIWSLDIDNRKAPLNIWNTYSFP